MCFDVPIWWCLAAWLVQLTILAAIGGIAVAALAWAARWLRRLLGAGPDDQR